jgi:hypothetical protein
MTFVLHPSAARSQRRSRHAESGLYVDRSLSGAVVMAWDKAQRIGHEWVPLDNIELQLWFAALPPYVSPSRRCGTTAK